MVTGGEDGRMGVVATVPGRQKKKATGISMALLLPTCNSHLVPTPGKPVFLIIIICPIGLVCPSHLTAGLGDAFGGRGRRGRRREQTPPGMRHGHAWAGGWGLGESQLAGLAKQCHVSTQNLLVNFKNIPPPGSDSAS